MKRVIATALFFALLSLVFFEAVYWFLEWNARVSASVAAPGAVMEDGSAIKLHSALAALIGALVLTIPFFFGGPPAVLDLLKRCAVAPLVFGISSVILFIELTAFFLVISAIIHAEAGVSMQAGLAGDWKAIEGLAGEAMNPIIALSFLGAFLGAIVLAVSCLSKWLGAILLLLRRSITAFIFFGYSFAFLFVPIVYVVSSVVGAFVGVSVNTSVDSGNPQQHQDALQKLPETIRQFGAEHGIAVLVGSALVAGIIALLFSIAISFSDQLVWCRTPVRTKKYDSSDISKSFSKKVPPPPAKSTVPQPPPAPVTSGWAKRNPVKDKLYGDLPLDQWPPPSTAGADFPWSAFIAAREYLKAGRTPEAIACWQRIAAAPNLESLHYAQAWHFLRQNGVKPPPEEAKTVLGVVGENGPSGVLTAVFADGQARIYSDKGQAVIWGRPDASLDPLVESVLMAATNDVQKTIPWERPRPTAPDSSLNRISILTPSGLHFSEGPPTIFEATPAVKPIADGLGMVIRALMQKTGPPK